LFLTLRTLLISSCNIIDVNTLDDYIYFCLKKSANVKIPTKTELHHILPNSLFPAYNNLKLYKWNGVHLSHLDHFHAHYLLQKFTDAFTMNNAFYAMCNKNVKLNKITQKDIDYYGNAYTESKTKFYTEMSKKRKSNEWKTTKGILQIERRLATMNETIVTYNSEYVTLAEATRLKQIKSFNTVQYKSEIVPQITEKRLKSMNEVIDFEGKTMTKFEKKAILNSKYKDWISRRFDVYDKNHKLIYNDYPTKLCNKISQNLIKSSKNAPLFTTGGNALISKAINSGKEHLIGYYVIETLSFKDRGINKPITTF